MTPPPPDRTAVAYDAHYDTLRFIATQKFRVPAADVRSLIHDVFLAYMRHSASIGDDRGWLVAATRNACLNYWRDKKCNATLTDTIEDPRAFAEDVFIRLDLVIVLKRLPRTCRKVLWQRYVEGRDPADIAAGLSKARTYGRQIVHRCLRAARESLASLRSSRA